MSTHPPSKAVPPVVAGSSRSRWILIGSGGAAVVALIAGIWIWKSMNEPPRYNAPTLELVKFMTSKRFEKLPFDQRKPYLILLEQRDDNDDIDRLFNEGKITEEQGRTAKGLAWEGKWLSRMDVYYAKPTPGAQSQWVAKYVDRREKDKAKEKTAKKPANQLGIERDETSEQFITLAWPKETQERFNSLRQAIKTEEKKHKSPTTRPE